MAWLRVDDGMTEHRKVLMLPRKDRWTWMELLTYVARQNNGGHVPEGICDVLRWVTPAFLERCSDIGLLDVKDTGFFVHDWEDYNPKDPTKTERQRRWRAKQRESVDGDVDACVDGSVDGFVDTPTRARARVPSPTPTPSTSTAAARPPEDHDPHAAALYQAGWSKTQIHQAGDDLERAHALLHAAQADSTCTSPGALAWTKFKTGQTTTQPPEPKRCPECGIVIRPPTTLTDHLWQTHDIELTEVTT